ncbi:hypothetical protein F5Y16DRAFT_358769 [Xylariaceae sp. FL0255]|nr:hypothetical protein F5Y16DRAFT_358769 [Xylariaceae sp. FL0255]
MDSPTLFREFSLPVSLFLSTPKDNLPAGFPDYSVWTPERWAAYPGLSNYHDLHKERVWWWKYGYRLRDPTRPKN